MKKRRLITAVAVISSVIVLIILESNFFFFYKLKTIFSSNKYVNINQLTNYPRQYSDKNVCTIGSYRKGFEVSSLSTSGENVNIWVATDDIRSPLTTALNDYVVNKYKNVSGDADTKPNAFIYKTRKVFVCGIFRTGQGFGHLSAYPYMIAGRGRNF